MDLQNRNNFGSVRRLRDRFEQSINNNNFEVDNRNFVETNGFSNKIDPKLKISPKPQIIDKCFAEKLNKTLKYDNNHKNLRTSNLKVGSDGNLTNGLSGESRQSFRVSDPEPDGHNKPNPVPKPPRTFAHDLYLELKFSKPKESVVTADKNMPLYSVPNKANKLKYRNRSQSDSRVMDPKKSNQFNSTEHIYNDCINHKTLDKTFKSYILRHFPCIRPDLK